MTYLSQVEDRSNADDAAATATDAVLPDEAAVLPAEAIDYMEPYPAANDAATAADSDAEVSTNPASGGTTGDPLGYLGLPPPDVVAAPKAAQ